jgi:TonB family protein
MIALTNDRGGARTKNGNGKNRSLPRLALALLLFCLAINSVPAVRAQPDAHPNRKVIQSQKADYPRLLKVLGIGGIVRLNAKVLANGTVAQVSILGGNPILAESAAQAVMTWKYAAAALPSNEVVTIEFNAHE